MKILQHYVHPQVLLLAGLELVLAFLGFAFSSWLFADVAAESLTGAAFAGHASLFAVLVVVGIAATGLYGIQQRLRFEEVIVRVAVGIAFAAIGLAVLNLLVPIVLSRLPWLTAFVVAFVLLCLLRYCFPRLLDPERFRRRVLVYGAGKRAASLLELRRHSDQRGFRIVAFVPAAGDDSTLSDERVTVTELPLIDMAHELRATEIVVAMDDRRRGFPVRELLECKLSGIGVVDILTFLERETGCVKIDLMHPGWIIFSEGFSQASLRRVTTRIFDLVGSLILLTVSFPLMLVIAIAILAEDGFPVLFRQQRVGLLGLPFTLYKFRSMRSDAEADGSPRWAQPGDLRVTRVGRVIRKLRLDELPQLINIVRGDMSIVGPRPERPEFVTQLAEHIPFYHDRHYVKPGLTGWAQLCYPYGASQHDALKKLQYDMYYVKNQSLVFDLMILLQTAEVVLWRKGSR